MTTATDAAALFRSLHVPGRPLLLANAWDVASALLVAETGAAAVATTSAGVAWSLGADDGATLGRERAVDLVARIAGAVRVPVTADVEDGYASDPAGVAATVEAVLAAGAIGVNLEDADHTGAAQLLPVDRQAERIAAARQAGGQRLFLNARVDSFLRGVGTPEQRLQDALARAAAYVAAGADGIFVPGATDPAIIARLVEGVAAPLNVLVGPGAPPVGELARLGVARVSLGSSIAEAAYATVRRAARELSETGTYDALIGGVSYPELNNLLATPAPGDGR